MNYIVSTSIVMMAMLAIANLVGKPTSQKWLLAALFGNGAILTAYLWVFVTRHLQTTPSIFMVYAPAAISLATCFYILIRLLVEEREIQKSDLWEMGPSAISWIMFFIFQCLSSDTKIKLISELYLGHRSLVFFPVTMAAAGIATFFLLKTVRLDTEYYRFTHSNRKRLTGVTILIAIAFVIIVSFSTISIAVSTHFATYGVSLFAISVLIGLCIHIQNPKYFLSWIVDFKNHYRKRNYLSTVNVDELKRSLESKMVDSKRFKDNDLTLETLAEELGVSKYQLSQLINGTLNTTFTRYIQGFRVAEAQRLLSTFPERTILSIAYEVGFNSNSVFQSAFRANAGLTPSEYRDTKR